MSCGMKRKVGSDITGIRNIYSVVGDDRFVSLIEGVELPRQARWHYLVVANPSRSGEPIDVKKLGNLNDARWGGEKVRIVLPCGKEPPTIYAIAVILGQWLDAGVRGVHATTCITKGCKHAEKK